MKEGKVREVYDIGDSLIIVPQQTEFLHLMYILKNKVTEKRCDSDTDV